MRVYIIVSSLAFQLEVKINDFLKSCNEEVVSIQYSSNNHGYSAMIILK